MDIESFRAFSDSMWNELSLHRDEKTGLKNMSLVQIYELTMKEISSRDEIMRTHGPDVIKKQCVHMANYLYFLWVALTREIK